MGLFAKKEVETPTPTVQEQKIEGTVIGEGMTFVGDFTTEDKFELKGSIRGNIVTPGAIHIDKSGYHRGNINAKDIVIDGSAEANIDCQDTVTLTDTAKLVGNLKTANLDAAHGSEFMGNIDLKHVHTETRTDLLQDGDVAVTEEDIFG